MTAPAVRARNSSSSRYSCAYVSVTFGVISPTSRAYSVSFFSPAAFSPRVHSFAIRLVEVYFCVVAYVKAKIYSPDAGVDSNNRMS